MLRDLVRFTRRLSPDRIVIGEVRPPDALGLLKAWMTGHPGGAISAFWRYTACETAPRAKPTRSKKVEVGICLASARGLVATTVQHGHRHTF